jgi:hypothetical protein
MQESPCSGYTVKAIDFLKELPESVHNQFADAIAEKDEGTVDEILNEFMPSDFPGYESVFVLKDEDNADGLERGVVYIIFKDEDLFVQTPTRSHDLLRAKGIIPAFNRWTTWG